MNRRPGTDADQSDVEFESGVGAEAESGVGDEIEIRTVLIYDGECPYCSMAATAVRRLEDVAVVSWYDDAAQEFLTAQFGEVPFAMVLVDADEGRVYAGRAAARELADRAGTPNLVGSLLRDNYERIASAVGRASGRDREADPYHEAYQIEESAAGQFDALAAAAREAMPEELQ